jgi:hypothetical protein
VIFLFHINDTGYNASLCDLSHVEYICIAA